MKRATTPTTRLFKPPRAASSIDQSSIRNQATGKRQGTTIPTTVSKVRSVCVHMNSLLIIFYPL